MSTAGSNLTSPNPWDHSAPQNAFERATSEYRDYRPAYPDLSVRAALRPGPLLEQNGTGSHSDDVEPSHVLDVVDIGAGTGKFTAKLLEYETRVKAVEPAAAMRSQLAELAGDRCEVVDGTAEATGLPDKCADVITYAQAWHWFDGEAALAEARRLLRPGGHVAIIFNQMDVSVPWVHRLTRIMRSGDIHTPKKVPEVGPDWSEPILHRADFSTKLKPVEVMGLARTRSSYLKSTEANRARMQENLRWYLHDHLGYASSDDVEIPYYTLVWLTRPL